MSVRSSSYFIFLVHTGMQLWPQWGLDKTVSSQEYLQWNVPVSTCKLKLYTHMACYTVDGDWTATDAWRAVLKASIVWTSVVVGGSLFQSWMVLGKNDIFTVTLVYGTKSFCDSCVLLLLDRMMDSDSGISTNLCLNCYWHIKLHSF